jgi:hypothetical protein
MDRDLGLIHVRRQTWFPMQVQVYVNGHEWLARTLTRHGIRYTKQDNAFLWIEDFPRAQHFAERFVRLGWMPLLDRYAQRVQRLGPGGRPHARPAGPRHDHDAQSAAGGRTVTAFNPVARPDSQLFIALMSGDTPCTASRIAISAPSWPPPRFGSATTRSGRALRSADCSTASVKLRQRHFPTLYAEAA